VRIKVYRAVLAGSIILGGLFWANPAMAADPPYTDGTLNARSGGGVTATGFTSGWNKGTVSVDTALYNNNILKNTTKNDCTASTACHNNPTPIVSCGCPGQWILYVDAYGPRTNGVTSDHAKKEVLASIVDGKLVLKVISETHTRN
jgi:hypothetical protein